MHLETHTGQRCGEPVALALQGVAQCGDPGVLVVQRVGDCRLERAAGDVAEVLLGRPNPGHQFGGPAGPADLPPGAVEHLGRAGDGHGALGHARIGGGRQVPAAVEGQVLVDLVGDHQQVGLDRQRGQPAQFLLGEDHPGRVVRGVDDDRPGARRDGGADRVDVEAEPTPVGHQWHGDPPGARHGDRRRVGVEERLDHQHLRTRLDQSDHRRRDRLAGSHGDQHLGIGVELHPVVAAALGGDGPAQPCDARPGRVLVETVGDRPARRLQHRRRSVLVGEALTEVDRAQLGGERRHLREDVDDVGPQTLDRHGTRA